MTQQTQTPAQQQAQQQTVTVTLPVDALNIVLASLAKQPFEAVAELITIIRTQAIEQLKANEVQQLPITEHEGAAE